MAGKREKNGGVIRGFHPCRPLRSGEVSWNVGKESVPDRLARGSGKREQGKTEKGLAALNRSKRFSRKKVGLHVRREGDQDETSLMGECKKPLRKALSAPFSSYPGLRKMPPLRVLWGGGGGFFLGEEGGKKAAGLNGRGKGWDVRMKKNEITSHLRDRYDHTRDGLFKRGRVGPVVLSTSPFHRGNSFGEKGERNLVEEDGSKNR